MQITADTSVGRTSTAQQVSDVVADLAPGQRVLAEIQAVLPNGAYRALINQREIVLALPFSAKAGDALELEVVESADKLALALISQRSKNDDAMLDSGGSSVKTTLSHTGNFIASLFGRSQNDKNAQVTALNANKPIAATPPETAADLLPQLKQAISQSGMFYESHQAQWASNRWPTEALLSEPQGQHSPLIASDKSAAMASQMVANDLVPLVQQQLEALANQTYVWQGLAWPGQPMHWEIEENGWRNPEGEPDEETKWQTRLTLTMPELGEVRAAIRINGGEIALSLSAEDNTAEGKLSSRGQELLQQLEAAGLKVVGFSVGRHDPTER